MAKLAELRTAGSESRMLNLVEKFTPLDLAAADDEGAVAIEYVLAAGFLFAGVGLVFSTTDLWQGLAIKLDAFSF